ncbi:MAG: signal peptidase I [Oscillospiraceae bacterium]|nr:signal peptidase I [Oscillospiraceae bacterium]
MNNEHEHEKGHIKKLPSVAGVVICLLLIPMLIINLTIVIKSYLNPDKVPDFFGLKPFVVLSGSMEPAILAGDLVFIKTVDPLTLKTGDIISFKEGNNIVTHRIVELTEKGGEPAFLTRGDANNTSDRTPVTYSQLEGIYLFRIGMLGTLAIFIQTPMGMLIFACIPLIGFVLYDILRRSFDGKTENESNMD